MPASVPWILPGRDEPKCFLIIRSGDKKSLAGYKQASLDSISAMMTEWLASNRDDLEAIYGAVHAGSKTAKASSSTDPLGALFLNEFQFGRLVAFEAKREPIPLPAVVVRAASKGVDPGNWTDSDRENDTPRWRSACLHNLRANNFSRYTRIIERRDFYRWFYKYTVDLGYTTRWALAAYIVASGAYQVAEMGPFKEDLGRTALTVNNELQGMMREGNQLIFDNVFPKLRQLLLGGPLTGAAALDWDMRILSEEQMLIQPLYKGISPTTLSHLKRIARQDDVRIDVAAWFSDTYVEKEAKYNKGGEIPPFTGSEITSINERWLYGMSLVKKFAPHGADFTLADLKRPTPSADYASGAEFARVRTRPNLHQLDAALDGGGAGMGWLRLQVESILGRLTSAEQAELVRDRKPGGGHYSVECGTVCRSMPRSSLLVLLKLLAGWRVSLEGQLRFLDGFLKGVGGTWRGLDYSDIAPIIRPFTQAEKDQLHTPFWQRIFTQVCDDKTIVTAVKDLGLREPLKTQWIDHETSLF